MIADFWNGFGLGVSVAAPIGPVAIVILRTALARGRLCGMAVAAGAVTVDALYLGLATWGAATYGFSPAAKAVLSLVGSAVLLRTAYGTWKASGTAAGIQAAANPAAPPAPPQPRGSDLLSSYGAGLLVTSTNPVTVMFWATIGSAIASTNASVPDMAATYAGVLCGVLAWGMLAANFWAFARGRVSARVLRVINMACAAALVFYSARLLWRGILIAGGAA